MTKCAAVCLGLTTTCLAARAVAQEPMFRAAVNMVSVTVTVTDQQGRFITDLGPDDFAVFEEGIARPVELFERERTSAALAVVMDASRSMQSRLPLVRRAVRALLATLRTGDEVALIACDKAAQLAHGLTPDLAAFATALDRISAGGTTSLYDAVTVAADELQRSTGTNSGRRRRGVIVVLSDGGDTSSAATADEMLARVRGSGAVVYTIDVSAPDSSSHGRFARILHDGAQNVLRRLAEHSGGRAFRVTAVDALPAVYDEIALELTSQYLLGFAPGRDSSGEWRRISVAVKRSGSLTRARSGYILTTS